MSLVLMLTNELIQTIPPPLHNTLIQSPRPIRHISLPPARSLDNPLAIFLPGYRPPPTDMPRPTHKRTRTETSLTSRALKRTGMMPTSPKRTKRVLFERLLNRRSRSTSSCMDNPMASVRTTSPRNREPSPLSIAHLPERNSDHSARKLKREINDSVAEESSHIIETNGRTQKKRKVSEVGLVKSARLHRPPPLQSTSSVLEPPKTPGSGFGGPMVSPVVTGFPVHTADESTMNHVSDCCLSGQPGRV
jgi:hypothetical protein